jgi:prepilin-type N-terminal cleavage/methylation domain-containing protein
MKTWQRVSNVEPPALRCGAPGCPVRKRAVLCHSSFVIRHFREAFTLIELLTVIAIIGILAALLAPVFRSFAKPDATVSATRQMLDDVARARALAIADRSTVYMVFIPTNFWAGWGGAPEGAVANAPRWNQVPVAIKNSMVTTQAYGAQMNGYFILSLRDVGDQPGQPMPKDLMSIKTLPQGSFIAPYKFTTTVYGDPAGAPYPLNRPDLPIYGFQRTKIIPFPTATVLTNAGGPNPDYLSSFQSLGGLTLPYIAFNYLGQLTPGDGSVLPYDENIPLAYGTFGPALDPVSKLPIQASPIFSEEPPGNSTNISYNLIHIDRLTGRARVERQDAL